MTEQEWTDLQARVAGHTKGPWVDDGGDMFGDHAVGPEDSLAVAAVVANLKPADEVGANAALIAAAPALMEEARRLREENARLSWVHGHAEAVVDAWKGETRTCLATLGLEIRYLCAALRGGAN